METYEANKATTAGVRRTKGIPRAVQAFYDVVAFYMTLAGKHVWSDGILNKRPVRGGSSWSLHAEARAIDYGVPSALGPQKFIGDEVAFRSWYHHEALGVIEIIWNRRRWTPEKGWLSYHGVDPHTSHVHVGVTKHMAASTASHDALGKWFGTIFFANN